MTDRRITHMTPDALISRAQRERQQLAALWENLTEAQLTQRPGVQDDWSVKDFMAHIVAWEKYVVQLIEAILNNENPQLIADYHHYNADILRANKDRPLAEVQAEFEDYVTTLVNQIGRLSEAQLNEATIEARDDVGVYTRKLLDIAIADTFGHYAEHAEDVKAYVSSL